MTRTDLFLYPEIIPALSRSFVIVANQMQSTGSERRIRKPTQPLQAQIKRPVSRAFDGGAGDGDRTHAASLEGWNSTIELHPLMDERDTRFLVFAAPLCGGACCRNARCCKCSLPLGVL